MKKNRFESLKDALAVLRKAGCEVKSYPDPNDQKKTLTVVQMVRVGNGTWGAADYARSFGVRIRMPT